MADDNGNEENVTSLPLQWKVVGAQEAEAALKAIFNDLQTRHHDDWDWFNARFYLDVLMETVRAGSGLEYEALCLAVSALGWKLHGSYPELVGTEIKCIVIVRQDELVKTVITTGTYVETALGPDYQPRITDWGGISVVLWRPLGIGDYVEQLTACEHTNTSLWREGLKVCFDCGSTIRRDEGKWTAPRIWRRET